MNKAATFTRAHRRRPNTNSTAGLPLPVRRPRKLTGVVTARAPRP